MKNQKIIALALALLIIAGGIVVALKGFNVDFMLKQHDSIEYKIDSEYEMSDVENICSEVFGDKNYKIRVIELFNDAISINAEKITKEEADSIFAKLNEKYGKTSVTEENTQVVETTDQTDNDVVTTENSSSDYEIISNPKIKLMSLFKPYILPSILSGLAIIVYAGIRFRKLNSKKVILKLVGIIVVTVLAILSILAIVRFPINTLVIPVIMLIVLFELVLFFAKYENKLKSI